jgi:Prominin
MLQQSQELLFLSKDLEKNLKFGEPSFEDAILKFLQEVKEAQEFIGKYGTETARQLARELAEEFTTEITDYLYLVINKTENEVGRCGPLSNVYKAVYVATCKRVVDPFVSIFWCGVFVVLTRFFPNTEWILDGGRLVLVLVLPNVDFLGQIVNAVPEI